MILEQLSIVDFRVFEGKHTFDLAPRVKYGKKRPIILFGGLNGAGKTTTLTAVRLALYGRQSLGKNVAQKTYDEYLTKSIHRSKGGGLQANAASIELTFTYAHMGLLKHYTVKRTWHASKKKVTENLSISENGEPLSELNAEQCQGFLNELIPIGVSDLFFFDGEKIAELAEDTKGEALGDAIKNLLGLNIIQTLNADLGVLIRNESKKHSSVDQKNYLTGHENQLKKLESDANTELNQYEQLLPEEQAIRSDIARLEDQLSSRGGAWAATRESEITREAKLNEERRITEDSLRELYSGSFPISLAENFAQSTLDQLKKEAAQKRLIGTSEIVQTKIINLQNTLKKLLDKKYLESINQALLDEFKEITDCELNVTIIHDISESLLSRTEGTIHEAATERRQSVEKLHERLSGITDEIDKLGKNIARAPQESQIKPILEQINKAHEKLARNLQQQKVHVENHKRLLREALTTARELDKASKSLLTDQEKSRALTYASNSKALLVDFASEMSRRKVKDLENEFALSFKKLSRKEDIELSASIDPETFSVMLLGSDGNEIDKNDLSAGEKQIYAISILEALARTSGRRLPIIIDTPLGRLDSHHRTNLVQNYFPNASHQVIILSTDTEVDEGFYSELSPSISHAFKLDYEPDSKSTFASEGYFWRHKESKAS